MKIITLLFIYNSRIITQYLGQNMTLCECLRRCTGMCNESRVTCIKKLWMVAVPQIRCQLHDHAKQYDYDEACHNKRNGGKLHGNISPNGYGNAIIGRYGGCFEEGKWWVYGTCNTPVVKLQWSSVTPRDRCARCLPVICCCCLVIACVSCIAYHVIMCISFAYMFVSLVEKGSNVKHISAGLYLSRY